jgi:hypothetical protein
LLLDAVNSNRFVAKPDISDVKIVAAANQLVSLGLKDAGYEYVNIDVRFLF